jgi:hypothetical protein
MSLRKLKKSTFSVKFRIAGEATLSVDTNKKKAKIVGELSSLLTSDAEGWKLMADRGKFRNGLTRVLAACCTCRFLRHFVPQKPRFMGCCEPELLRSFSSMEFAR